MAKTNTAQITIQPTCKVAESFTEAVELAFLRRDAWLNHVLSVELPRIETELAGHCNSPAARRFIETQAASRARVAMTVSLDRRVAEQIRELCDKHGVVRDALFNRIFFLLTSSPEDWATLNSIPVRGLEIVAGDMYEDSDGRLTGYEQWLHHKDVCSNSPLSLPAEVVRDPFSFHRAVLDFLGQEGTNLFIDDDHDHLQGTSFSTMSFASAPPHTQSHLAAYDLVIPDSLVPGTEAWEERMSLGKQLLDRLKDL